jgi:hypothetical protein
MASPLLLLRSSLCRPRSLVPGEHPTLLACYFGGAWPAYVTSHGVHDRSAKPRPGIRTATNRESELSSEALDDLFVGRFPTNSTDESFQLPRLPRRDLKRIVNAFTPKPTE